MRRECPSQVGIKRQLAGNIWPNRRGIWVACRKEWKRWEKMERGNDKKIARIFCFSASFLYLCCRKPADIGKTMKGIRHTFSSFGNMLRSLRAGREEVCNTCCKSQIFCGKVATCVATPEMAQKVACNMCCNAEIGFYPLCNTCCNAFFFGETFATHVASPKMGRKVPCNMCCNVPTIHRGLATRVANLRKRFSTPKKYVSHSNPYFI